MIPTWFLLVLGLLPVAFTAVVVYYEHDTAAGRQLRKRGVTQRGITAATVLSLGTVLAFGFLGDSNIFDPAVDVRGIGYATIGFLVPYVLGLLGLNIALTHARRWRRLHPDNDVPTGSLGTGEVACTGEVTDANVGTAPVTDRAAVCWSWSVEVLDPHGVSDIGQREQWVTIDGGDSGVTFAIDDGSGPVRVDPENATLDLGATRSVPLDADESPSFGSPAPDVERDQSDRERCYEESIAAPGDHVAVAGAAQRTDDALVVGGEDAHVAVGTLSTVASRYRTKAAMYGVAGLAGTIVGLDLLSGLYGVV